MEMPIARSVNSIGVTEIGHLGPAIRSEIAKKNKLRSRSRSRSTLGQFYVNFRWNLVKH